MRPSRCSFAISDRRQPTLWWNDGSLSLHRSHAFRYVIPDLVRPAGRVESNQLQNSDKLKVNRIAIIVLVAVLRNATSPLSFLQRRSTISGAERNNALLANSPNSRRTVHHHAKLK